MENLFFPPGRASPWGAQRVHPSHAGPGLCPATGHWFRVTCSHNQTLKVAKDTWRRPPPRHWDQCVRCSPFTPESSGPSGREVLTIAEPSCRGPGKARLSGLRPMRPSGSGTSQETHTESPCLRDMALGGKRPLLAWWPHRGAHVPVSCHLVRHCWSILPLRPLSWEFIPDATHTSPRGSPSWQCLQL